MQSSVAPVFLSSDPERLTVVRNGRVFPRTARFERPGPCGEEPEQGVHTFSPSHFGGLLVFDERQPPVPRTFTFSAVFANLFYRLMGARVGPECVLSGTALEYDLLSLEARSCVGVDCDVTNHTVENMVCDVGEGLGLCSACARVVLPADAASACSAVARFRTQASGSSRRRGFLCDVGPRPCGRSSAAVDWLSRGCASPPGTPYRPFD